MFSSDYFCDFGLLSFFPLPYTACLGVFVLSDFNQPIIPSAFNEPYFLHFSLFKFIHIIYRYYNWFKK